MYYLNFQKNIVSVNLISQTKKQVIKYYLGEQKYHEARIKYSNSTDLGTKIQRVCYLKSFIKSKYKADFLLHYFWNTHSSLNFLDCLYF